MRAAPKACRARLARRGDATAQGAGTHRIRRAGRDNSGCCEVRSRVQWPSASVTVTTMCPFEPSEAVAAHVRVSLMATSGCGGR